MISYHNLKGGCGSCNGNVFEIIGDGVTTAFPITHGFNSKDLIITTRQASTPFSEVAIDTDFTSNTVVTFTFAVAPAVGTMYVVSIARTSTAYRIQGDGATTAFTITHNQGTRNILVGIRQNFSPFNKVVVPTAFTTVNTITVTFGAAPSSSQSYSVSIIPIC